MIKLICVADFSSYYFKEVSSLSKHVEETVNNCDLLSFRLSDEAGLAVNFNIHMDPAKGETSATEITEILTQEILSSNITGKIQFSNTKFCDQQL